LRWNALSSTFTLGKWIDDQDQSSAFGSPGDICAFRDG